MGIVVHRHHRPSQPPPPTDRDADFLARRTLPGTVRVVDFNSLASIAEARTTGLVPSGNTIEIATADPSTGNAVLPSLDTDIKASGVSSLKFCVPSQSGQNGGGRIFIEFSNNFSVLFGAPEEVGVLPGVVGSHFYVQWRARWSDSFLTQLLLSTSIESDGVTHLPVAQKFMLLTAGDIPAGGILDPNYPGGQVYGSCELTEIVCDRAYCHPNPIVYHACNHYWGFYQAHTALPPPYTGFDQIWEPAMPNPPGAYHQWFLNTGSGPTAGPNNVEPIPGWFQLFPDEWMTFELEVLLGSRGSFFNGVDYPCFSNSEVRFWGARQGQLTPTLITDWNPSINGYFPLWSGNRGTPYHPQYYGCCYLMPYMTNKDNTQVHDPCYWWADEFIVSKNWIPFPQV